MSKQEVVVTKNKRIFPVKLVDGTETLLSVTKPNQEAQKEAQKIHNKAFREAIDSGAILRAAITKVMREQNLWDDKRQKAYDKLQRIVTDGEKALSKGGIPLSKARKIADEMRTARAELREMLTERNQLDLNTAESQAENEKFACLVAKCTRVEATGKLFFRDYEDYKERQSEDAAVEAANHLAKLVYELDDEWVKKLPENQFLIKHKFVNEDLRYINRKGELVDREGRRVNEDGWYIDEQGNPIDQDGTPIDKEGNYIVEFKDFIDDLDEVEEKPTKSEVVASVGKTKTENEEEVVLAAAM